MGLAPETKIYCLKERATPITQSGLYLSPPLSFIDLFYTQARLNLDDISPFTSHKPSSSHQKERQEALGKRESEINEMPCGSRLPQGISFLFAGGQLADRLIVRFALTCRVA